MNSRDITVYLDERWYNALSKHLKDETLEEHLENVLDEMCSQLPLPEYTRISREIWQEEQRNKAAAEAGRRFSLTQITENGESRRVLLERGEIMFQTALRLRRYLRCELQDPAQFYGDATPITQEEMERYTAEMLRGSPRVVGIYDIDLDAGEVYSLDFDKGWRGYQIKDVSTAVYFATKRESDDWIAKRSRFNQRLAEKEIHGVARSIHIRGDESLPTDLICFEDEISQIDNLLNFYIPVYFNPDQVFGLDVENEENADFLNLYANYDMEHGCICETLDVFLVRGSGQELVCEYSLTPEEQELLRTKMDSYCMAQMGIPLEKAREQYLAEEQGPASPKPLQLSVQNDVSAACEPVVITDESKQTQPYTEAELCETIFYLSRYAECLEIDKAITVPDERELMHMLLVWAKNFEKAFDFHTGKDHMTELETFGTQWLLETFPYMPELDEERQTITDFVSNEAKSSLIWPWAIPPEEIIQNDGLLREIEKAVHFDTACNCEADELYEAFNRIVGINPELKNVSASDAISPQTPLGTQPSHLSGPTLQM